MDDGAVIEDRPAPYDAFADVYDLWVEATGDGAEHVAFYADLYSVPKAERPDRLERLYTFSRLDEFTDRLAGKRLVIWQFAERELAMGDWKPLPLP